jgi:hypothetical protein
LLVAGVGGRGGRGDQDGGGDVRAALRATLVANAYLDAEIERLTEAVSTGFARGRMREAATACEKLECD